MYQKKIHTIPNTLYTKEKQKRRLEILKEERKRNGGSYYAIHQSRAIIRSSCSAYILFMQSTK